MRYGSVYLLTNKRTGEQYVGQTVKTVARRWYAHCISAQNPKFPVSKNIASYGKDAFTVQEIFVAFTKKNLDWAEQEFIAALSPSLNRTRGGAGSAREVAAHERVQRSEAAKRRWSDPVWREKTLASMRAAPREPVPLEVLVERGRAASVKRWAGHVKKAKPVHDRSAITAKSWQDPTIRQRRLQAMIAANALPGVRAKRSAAGIGRVHQASTIAHIARTKWKPVYCPELQTTFLSQKHAAEFLGVLKTSVANAVKSKGKVKQKFSLVRVA